MKQVKKAKKISARRKAYLERFAKEPPVKILRLSRRTKKPHKSPLPGVFTNFHHV